jgi:hypothetical protein
VSVGTAIDRQYVMVLHDGRMVIDWGNDLFQDIRGCEFFHCTDAQVSHHILDEELQVLKRAGRVDYYDSKQVYVYNLPERPQKLID